MSDSLCKQFHRDGFIGPFQVYEPGEADRIWKRIHSKLLFAKSKVYDVNPYNYDRHLDIDELSEHICHPEIISRLEAIIGRGILCWRSEVFDKKPGTKGTEWHQVEDFAYANRGTAQLEPTTKNRWGIVITVWTAWTPATVETSCLKFIPGSHNQSFFDENAKLTPSLESGFYGYRFADLSRDKYWRPDESKSVTMEMQPGESVIFTTMCLHGATPNISERNTRFSTNARYVQSSTKIFPDMNKVFDHEIEYDLKRYAAVLVSGPDRFRLNRTITENLNGFIFPSHDNRAF